MTSNNLDALKDREITVLMGGWSAEREISLNTGKAVTDSIKSLGLKVRGVDLTFPEEIEKIISSLDLVFIALHGRGGEDGYIQKILEENKELDQFDQLLNRIRSKIEIIEKQRCWLSVLNNRLYKKLRKELVENKDDINSDNIDKLNDILDNYINKGLKYSKTIDEISKRALGSIRNSIVEMKTFNDGNTSYENTSDEHTSNDESEEEISDDFDINKKITSVEL